MKTIYPLQSWGIGDVIFCQGLAKAWIEDGYRVVWGVEEQFLDGLIRAYPQVTFLDKRILNLNYDTKTRQPLHGDSVIAPIRWSDSIQRVEYSQVMKAKYDMYGLDYNTWRDVKPKRWMRKELELAKEADENHSSGYNLISPYYGSNSQFKLDIEPDNGLPNVYMSSVPGYSLFDWQLLIENATTIHAVSSSIVYLLELLDLHATEVHLYPRHHEPNTWLKNIEYLLTKEYVIH